MKFSALLCSLLMLLLTSAVEARTFTDTAGRKVEAEIVAKQGDSIRIRRADGNEFTLSLATLSPADQAYVQQWQPAASKPAAAPAPSADAKKVAEAEERKAMRVLEDVVIAKWDNAAMTFRWNFLPQLEVLCPEPTVKQFAEDAFKDLCQECQLGPAPGAMKLTLTIRIDAEAELRKLRLKDNEVSELFQFGTYCYSNFDAAHALNAVTIYICRDRYLEAELKSRLLGLLVCGFGFPELTREIKEDEGSTLSLFLAPVATFSTFDRKLLSFFYQHIPPGTKKAEVRTLFRKHWKP